MSRDKDLSLRDAIDRILRNFRTPDDQAKALEDIRCEYQHSIRLAEIADFCKLSEGNIPKYDCFTFALDLIDCQERIAVRGYAPRNKGPVKLPGIADVLPGASFLHFLQMPSQRTLDLCADYDLVVYSDRFGTVRHAGKIVSARIVSKWGMKGSLWQHGLLEVPSKYGTLPRFYSRPTKEQVRTRWLDYLGSLAQRVSGFTALVSVMAENKGKNLTAEELFRLAAKRTARGS